MSERCRESSGIPCFNINIPNFLYNGLKDAFDAARAGGESPLLDQDLQRNQSGRRHRWIRAVSPAPQALRADSRFNSNLANGNYSAVAATLNTLNYTDSLEPDAARFRRWRATAWCFKVNGFPDNFIVANPAVRTCESHHQRLQHQLPFARSAGHDASDARPEHPVHVDVEQESRHRRSFRTRTDVHKSRGPACRLLGSDGYSGSGFPNQRNICVAHRSE